MSTVFISYRRDGALVHARALFERLSREFGPQQVFIDLDGIDIGVDFVELIDRQLQGCRVLLALIDPEWLDASDREGRRRLDSETDFVRIEIARALQRGITVAPILLDGAQMPGADRLPIDLQALARRNAMALDFRRFDSEVSRLITTIRRILEPAKAEPPPHTTAPPTVEPEPSPRTQAVKGSPESPDSPKQTPVNSSVDQNRRTSIGSLSVTGTSTRWAAALIVGLVMALVVWSFSGRPTGETRIATEPPAMRPGTKAPSAELAQPAPETVNSNPSKPTATPPTSASPPLDTASPSGKRWIMEFMSPSRDKACGMLAADPDFAAASVWQQKVDPRFPTAPSFAVRFGPTTDRLPLDAIRKRYLDRGVFSVITAPRSNENELRVDCRKAEPEISRNIRG